MATDLQPATRDGLTTAQIELVKRNYAPGATDDELKMFIYDCQRQGVDPRDRLIHFTKRGGKYTPITSIDFMRMRAADTGEYAGSDDATFVTEQLRADGKPISESYPLEAHVTVWRLVQGQRCAFAATARWAEYYPGDAQGHMWRKMPHTMLAKCAEALALRKGFPRQLAGLYAREELDQAEQAPVYTVENDAPSLDAGQVVADTVQNPAPTPELPPEALQILRVEKVATKKAHVFRYYITFSNHLKAVTIQEWLASLCEQCAQQNIPVLITTKTTQWSKQKDGTVVPDLVKVRRADEPEQPHLAPMTDDEIPF